MKKWIIFGLLTLLSVQNALGQRKEFILHYFAHNAYNESVINQIETIYYGAIPSNTVYLFLADRDESVIVQCAENNESEFNELRDAVNSAQDHTVWPDYDVDAIIRLLASNDFLDSAGRMKYDVVTFNFYITKEFWVTGLNNKLIARLCWDLDLDKYQNVNIRIFHPRAEDWEGPLTFDAMNLMWKYNVKLLSYGGNYETFD